MPVNECRENTRVIPNIGTLLMSLEPLWRARRIRADSLLIASNKRSCCQEIVDDTDFRCSSREDSHERIWMAIYEGREGARA